MLNPNPQLTNAPDSAPRAVARQGGQQRRQQRSGLDQERRARCCRELQAQRLPQPPNKCQGKAGSPIIHKHAGPLIVYPLQQGKQLAQWLFNKQRQEVVSQLPDEQEGREKDSDLSEDKQYSTHSSHNSSTCTISSQQAHGGIMPVLTTPQNSTAPAQGRPPPALAPQS